MDCSKLTGIFFALSNYLQHPRKYTPTSYESDIHTRPMKKLVDADAC